MTWFSFLFGERHPRINAKTCSPEYIKQRKAELIAEEIQKELEYKEGREQLKAIVATRNKIPHIGDLMCEYNCQTYEVILVEDIYKGVVIGKSYYRRDPFENDNLSHSCYGTKICAVTDLMFENVHELKSYTLSLSAKEIKRAHFLIDIKSEPFEVWCKLPEAEKKAIDKLSKECL